MSSTDTSSAFKSADQGPALVAVLWVFEGISTVIMLLRLYTKGILVKRFTTDDWLMLISWPLTIVWSILLSLSVHHGLGRHMDTLQLPEAIKAMHYDFSAQGFGVMSPMFGRISWTYFLLNFVGTSKGKKMVLYALIVAQVLAGVSTVILIYVQCGPDLGALWNPNIRAHATCWSPNVQTYYGFFQSAVNSFTDLCLTILPAQIVYKLQMKLRLKIAAGVLLGMSAIALGASIVKTYEIQHLGDRGDFTWNVPIFFIWTTVEIHLVLICGSVPQLRPLVASSRGRSMYESHEMYSSSRKRTMDNNSNHIWASNKEGRSVLKSNANSSEEDILGPRGIQKQVDIYVSEYGQDPERGSHTTEAHRSF